MTVVSSSTPDTHELRRADRVLRARAKRWMGVLTRLLRRASLAKDEVGQAARALQLARISEFTAELEAAKYQQLLDRLPRTGHPADAGRHGLSPWLYALIMGLAGIGGWLVNQGVLLVLRLPLALTEAIAVVLVLVTLYAAHWGGHITRRCHQSVYPLVDIGRTEINLGGICIAGGYILTLATATVRAVASGGTLSSLMFAVLGALDFTVALVASYLYANDSATARDRSRRQARRATKRANRAYHQLLRRVNRWRQECATVVTAATVATIEADQILAAGLDNYRRNHPGEPEPLRPEPDWLDRLRRVAEGELPAHLNVRPVLVVAEIDPDEVL